MWSVLVCFQLWCKGILVRLIKINQNLMWCDDGNETLWCKKLIVRSIWESRLTVFSPGNNTWTWASRRLKEIGDAEKGGEGHYSRQVCKATVQCGGLSIIIWTMVYDGLYYGTGWRTTEASQHGDENCSLWASYSILACKAALAYTATMQKTPEAEGGSKMCSWEIYVFRPLSLPIPIVSKIHCFEVGPKAH